MFPGAANAASYDFDLSLHSLTPSVDGKTTYLAYLRGGFGILDTSEVAADTDRHFISLNDTLLTPVDRFVRWGAGNHCAGHTPEGYSESHSAVPLPGRPFALTVDEVYGTLAAPSFGCPWGWIRLIMWSFPIVKDGLIYVMDVRNGLYVLRYRGPRSAEVSGLDFLEGNSNLGDAVRLAKSGAP